MKIKETKKKAEVITKKVDPNADLIAFITTCHQDGDNYRRKFKDKWDKCEQQIRCEHPSEWENKDDWQTKVFVPQQAKTVETASAYLDKMLFGNKRFYRINGVEKRDKDEEGAIMELFDNVLDRGNFTIENDFILNEASGIGNAFLKILVNPQRTGLQFIWRSPYNITIDPKCGHKLERARYVIDEYKKPITELIDELLNGTSVYKESKVKELIDKAEDCGLSLSEEAKTVIKGIDGTEVTIASEYRELNLQEFWGWAKIFDTGKNRYTFAKRLITIANGRVVLRNDSLDESYGFIPIFACRIKPRKYDFYACGFCENVVDLQELTNSMINLGFDSLKMCSMDMAMIDATKIKDAASIEYKPMAIWMLKGNPNEAVKMGRQGISALTQIMQGLSTLDQFNQEATGVLRQIQGAPDISGGDSGTLGEYQAKLAMIDNRFLKIARFIERDYIEPLLRGVFKILFNQKFFNQAIIDRILGTKEVQVPVGVDPMTQQPITVPMQMPKLDFNKIASAGEMGFDFRAVGMTNFSKSIETLQKLKELLIQVVQIPDLKVMVKLDEIFKRVLQAAEIPDYEDLMRSDEDIKKIMGQIYGGAQAPAQGAAGGAMPPAPNMMGGM